MSWITIRIYIVPVQNGGKVQPDAAHHFIDQIRNDALYGTYGKLDSNYWRQRMALDPTTLSEAELIGDAHEDGGLAGYEFELRLNSALFPPAMGGAPHLFGMLAGDLLRFTLAPIALRAGPGNLHRAISGVSA